MTLPRRRGLRVTSASVRVAGGKVRRVARRRRHTTVVLTGRAKGSVRVVLTVRGVRGGKRVTVRQVRTFRTCTRR